MRRRPRAPGPRRRPRATEVWVIPSVQRPARAGWIEGSDLRLLAEAADRLEVCAYEPSAAEVAADLWDVRRRVGDKARLNAILRPSHPDLAGGAETAAAARALKAAGCEGIAFYNYGHWRLAPWTGCARRWRRGRGREIGDGEMSTEPTLATVLERLDALKSRLAGATGDRAVSLVFLADGQRRVIDEQARLREDMAVLLAIVQRLDGTVQGLVAETRAQHARLERTLRRVDRLEAAES